MNNSWIKNNKISPPAPLGWEWIRLRDVTQVQGGFAFRSSDFTTSGIPVVRMSDLKQGMLDLSEAARVSDQTVCQLSQFMLETGDLIIGMSGSITNYAIVDEQNLPAYLNQRVGRLILKDKNRANYNYLTHVLRSPFYESWAYKEATGVAQLNISSQQIEAMYFFLPPLPEQRRIAEILDTIDEAIQKTEALISKLKAMNQGLLHDLLTRGLNKNGKLRDPKAHPVQFKDSTLGNAPRSWRVQKLQSFYDEPSVNGLYKPKKYYGHGPLMIHMPQMFRGLIIDTSDAARVEVNFAEIDRYGLRNGDLVFARRSLNLEGAGRCTLVNNLSETTTFESSIIRVRIRQDELLPEFVNYFLNSAIGFKLRLPLIRQVAVSGVSSGDIASIPIPCPSISEQERIIKVIEAHISRIRNEEQYRDKLKLQKKGIMHDLLTGKVRVEVEVEIGRTGF